ncbi:uncharacterized protein NEMAJ01_0375 [Nematocida major]|uniref:uncharacterized protein n=1 Tax=Nematocida major TaxID=1912982 RepID=UPI002008A248|nr:uncharacterized protein NEMAJ01_0375 [Nematocida major]KAH9385479.1 hypothetical protein NEMAJ01_0375 [Nematocida major]
MSDLPYYCHVCDMVIYIEDRLECPQCRESFLEVHTEDVDDEEEEAAPVCVRTFLGFPFFGCGKKQSSSRRHKSISSDRRNYALGPELDDIITRLRDEMGAEENPATDGQKLSLEPVFLTKSDVCTICLGSFEEGMEGSKFPCSHFFHQECTNAWLKLQSDCPVCRKPL